MIEIEYRSHVKEILLIIIMLSATNEQSVSQ